MHAIASEKRSTGLSLFVALLLCFGVWAPGCGTGGVRDVANSPADEPQGDLDPENARVLNSGVTQQGYIEYVGDADWFRLEIPLNTNTLRVELSNQVLQSTVDLSVTIYGSDGLTLLGGRYDPYGGDGLTQITLELTVEDLPFCFLAVRDYLGNDADPLNPYFLKATLTDGPGDGNNSPASATPLACGQELTEAIHTQGDVDWFQVELPAGSDILAYSFTMPPGSPDIMLTLYESMATTAIVSLSDPDGSDGTTSLGWNAHLLQTGTYYLAVRDALDDDADADLLYTLRAECLADPDLNEPNDRAADATALGQDSPVSGFLAFQEDEDWFRITMPGDGLLNLSLQTASGGIPLEFLVTILAGDGQAVEAESQVDVGEEPLDFSTRVALSAGTHYLRIQDDNDDGADAQNAYSVAFHFDPDPDPNEPNGNFPTRQENLDNATLLQLGIPGSGYIGSNADQDWFKVYVSQPGIHHFSIDNQTASAVDLSLSLYRPGGQSLILVRYEDDGQGEDGPTHVEGQLFFFDSGTYYLLVQDLNNNETDLENPYQIQVDLVPLPPGSLEPGEDRTDALMILSGQEVTGYMDFEGDRDWYGIEINGNWDIAVEIWSEAACPVEFIWFMYEPQSTTVYASAGDADEEDESPVYIRVAHNEPDPFWVDEDHPGVYIFKLSDYNRNDWDTGVPYHFRVTLSPHDPGP